MEKNNKTLVANGDHADTLRRLRRVDHFISDDPKKTFHLPIAGVFLVRDGKIQLWNYYSYPQAPS